MLLDDLIARIDIAIEVCGFATRKRQQKQIGTEVKSRVVWTIHKRAELTTLIYRAILGAEGEIAASSFKHAASSIENSRFVPWAKKQLLEDGMLLVLSQLELIDPDLAIACVNPSTDETGKKNLLRTVATIVDIGTAKAAIALWADLPTSQKQWIWRQCSQTTKDLITQASHPIDELDTAVKIASEMVEADPLGAKSFISSFPGDQKQKIWERLTRPAKKLIIEAIAQ